MAAAKTVFYIQINWTGLPRESLSRGVLRTSANQVLSIPPVRMIASIISPAGASAGGRKADAEGIAALLLK